MSLAGGRDLDNYQQEYVTSPFEEHLMAARREVVLEFLCRRQLKDILEVGCASRPLVESLPDFRSCIILEPGRVYFDQAQAAIQKLPAGERVKLFPQRFEDFAEHPSIDVIIISSLIHEIADAAGMLRHAFDIAPASCWLHINVPNAKSFHRLWAVEAGLIRNEYEKSAMQIRLQQSHTFDLDSLKGLVQQAGFAVEESGSYFIKPFSNAQMQQLVDVGILTKPLVRGLMKMERHLPGLGADIFVNARK
jgi:hypothetical protein